MEKIKENKFTLWYWLWYLVIFLAIISASILNSEYIEIIVMLGIIALVLNNITLSLVEK